MRQEEDTAVDEDAPTTVFWRGTRTTHRPDRLANDHAGLWDANDVARYLRVSRSWVYHRAEAGTLPCVRIGSLLRFDPEVIKNLARGAKPVDAVPSSHRRRA